MSDLDLTSPAFADGDPIPERYGYTADDVNPPLSIAGVPEEAESLALIVDDPDAMEPAGKVWDHWLVWNVPADTTPLALRRGQLPNASCAKTASMEPAISVSIVAESVYCSTFCMSPSRSNFPDIIPSTAPMSPWMSDTQLS